jgi:hypothetical protein
LPEFFSGAGYPAHEFTGFELERCDHFEVGSWRNRRYGVDVEGLWGAKCLQAVARQQEQLDPVATWSDEWAL